jgi:hypothetical protein
VLGVSVLALPLRNVTVRRPPAAPFAAAAAVLAGETLVHLANHELHGARFLDSSYEWSYSHALAALAFATGAVACGLGARRSRRASWYVACGAFAVLAVDAVGRLHTAVPAWSLLFAPLLAALAVAALRIARATELEAVVAGGIVLLGASLVIHVAGPPLLDAFGRGPESWAYQVKIALKEGTELAGWALVVPALVRLSRRAGRASAA